MYSFKLVEFPKECAAGCGTTVTDKIAGHYFLEPLCDACFPEAAPELLAAVEARQPVASIRVLQVCSAAACANCGDHLSRGVAGHHLGDSLCVSCFREHDRELAALLRLGEAALLAAASGQCAEDLLAVAVWYAKAIRRLGRQDPPAALSRLSRRTS